MARIKIKDLPKDKKISKEEMRSTLGGFGEIWWGGKEASLSGTGGVALLEFAKDAIQTAVSNISSVGTSQIQERKTVERKMSQG
jgi:hypothetical protein